MKLRMAWLSLLIVLALTVAVGEEHYRKNGRNAKDAASPVTTDQATLNHLGTRPGGNYNNGPINGTVNAWQFSSSIEVTDSFAGIGGYTPLLNFGLWLSAGDPLCIPVTACMPTSLELKIGDTAFGNNVYDGFLTVTAVNFHNFVLAGPGNPCKLFCMVYTVTASAANGGSLSASNTYWITLSNAVNKSGGPMYWDENSGPSQAQESLVGIIPSEAFTFQ